MQSERKFKSDLYDVLYETADLILEKFDPCVFQNGKCLRGEHCCDDCSYASKKGCATKALSCKLWLCDEARKKVPDCAAALDALNIVANRYDLLGYRLPKEKIIL